jgi:hypothetical protein
MTTKPKKHHHPHPPHAPALEWFPTPPEYDQAPELATLAILAGTLDAVSMVILAANPELLDDQPQPYWRPHPPTAPAAENILRQIDRLRRAVHTYRQVAAPKPSPDPTADPIIPF